ncbi:MAG: UDP-4-amino-4-deoxy-L-arabinose aminotransferase [Planctomycetes bacterium]|nr:UDP-4-amino-4-deoxy-L-arabinose aminotransferase [Planctomycetota bacterium]
MHTPPFLPFSRPSMGEAELAAVTEVLRSGWITTGPRCAELEERTAELCGARAAVSMTSATAGMHLALLAHGIGPGDEVITPSMTWVSTVNLITLLGATPVFADVDRDDLMVRREHVEPLVTERTRMIVPVHYAGAGLELAPLRELAAERGVALVEDAAHAIGTRCGDAPVGASGTAIFSLHPIKNVTSGEGGIVVTDDLELAARVKRLRFHGLGADAYARETQGRAPQAEVQEPGFKYNLPDMNAAVGVAQLARLDEFIERRAALAGTYLERLADLDGLAPLVPPSWPGRHAWHLFIVRVLPERAGLDRDELMAALKERGIGSGIHFRAAHLHRYYREQEGLLRAPLPNTEWNSERILSLPLFPDMTADDQERVIGALHEVLA